MSIIKFLFMLTEIPTPFNYIVGIVYGIIVVMGFLIFAIIRCRKKKLSEGEVFVIEFAKTENIYAHYEELTEAATSNQGETTVPILKRPLPKLPEVQPKPPAFSTFRNNRFTRSFGLSIRLPKHFTDSSSSKAPKLGPKPKMTSTHDKIVIVTSSGAWAQVPQRKREDRNGSDSYVTMTNKTIK